MKRWLRRAAMTISLSVLGLMLHEIFLNPEYISVSAIPELEGSWSDGTTQIAIDEAGRVSGSFNGQVMTNRTRFGKWLGWRTDYVIHGVSADLKAVSAPFNLTEGRMKGSLFRGGELDNRFNLTKVDAVPHARL